jgi:hypothetical protein
MSDTVGPVTFSNRVPLFLAGHALMLEHEGVEGEQVRRLLDIEAAPLREVASA